MLGQHHGGFAPFGFASPAHQAQQGAVRQAQEGPVVRLAPCGLALEAFGDVGQCLLVGPLVHLGGFILQAQRLQPVGNQVLNFQVVGCGGFQLARLYQRLLMAELAGLQLIDQHIQGFFVLPVAAETAVLGGLADFRVVEGFDGEGQRLGRRLVVTHGSPRRCAPRDDGKLRLGWLRFFLGHGRVWRIRCGWARQRSGQCGWCRCGRSWPHSGANRVPWRLT